VPIATLVKRAKSESGLVIYGNAPTAFFQPVIAAFNKLYPWIKVSDTDLDDNTVFSKYEAEAAQGARTADLLMASAPASWVQAEQNGATANVTPTGLDQFPAATSQGHGVYVMSPEPVVEVYSPKLLDGAQVPNSYGQLAADAKASPAKYRLVSYPIDNALNYAAIYGLIHILGAQKVWSYYSSFGANTKTYSEGLDSIQQVVQGGASVNYVVSGLAQGVVPTHFKGLAAVHYMRDATPLIPRGIAVSAKAASPASAQLFLDFLFSKPGQDALCAAGFEASMNGFQSKTCTASLDALRREVPAGTTYEVPISPAVLQAQSEITSRWNQAFHR
jgi:iron(III) transport system substrate-binding protein